VDVTFSPKKRKFTCNISEENKFILEVRNMSKVQMLMMHENVRITYKP